MIKFLGMVCVSIFIAENAHAFNYEKCRRVGVGNGAESAL